MSHSKRCTFVKKAMTNRPDEVEVASVAVEEVATEPMDDDADNGDNDVDADNDDGSTANDDNDNAVNEGDENVVDEQRTVEKKQTKRSAIAKTKAKANSDGKPAAKQVCRNHCHTLPLLSFLSPF